MTTLSPEQYAHRVSDALLKGLRRSGRERVAQLLTPDEAAQLILDTVPAPAQNSLAERIGPVWSSVRTREALGLHSRQALSSRRAHGSVLGITTTEGQVYYPLFQFRREGQKVEVHPNLVPALKALRDVDSWTVAAMLQSSDPDLGVSAAEWARRGLPRDRLVEWALTVKRELTRP